jgi:predicted TIM-barrel fold metal-dependent hydrolase
MGGGLALGLEAAKGWAKAAPPAARIVISETFVPTEWVEAFDQAGPDLRSAAQAFWRDFKAPPISRPEAGDLRLLSLPAPGVEIFEPALAKRLARRTNERLATFVRQAGRDTGGFATVSAFDREASREAEYAIAGLGLSGISLGANRGVRLDDRRLWPLYAFAEGAGAPIYLPAAYAAGAGDAPYRALGRAGPRAGASADCSLHATQLIFGGVFDAFPKLNVVLSRLGNGAAHHYGRLIAIEEGLGAGDRPRTSVREAFQRNIVLTSADLTSPDVSRFYREVIGRQRVVAAEPHIEGAANMPDLAATQADARKWLRRV